MTAERMGVLPGLCWHRCNACGHRHLGRGGDYRCSTPSCDCHDRFQGDQDAASKAVA